MLDAFAKDDALLHGKIGVIDADPLCACQAWENLRVEGVALTKAKADTVKARVVISNFDGRQRIRIVVVLTLSRTPAGGASSMPTISIMQASWRRCGVKIRDIAHTAPVTPAPRP